jgi:REP element-mobilizing transposase RayT
MPRQARLDAPGVVHHVIIRGIERRNIFLNNEDREDLLDRLDLILPPTETVCYAWAFLSNHAHFLFRTGSIPISSVMRRLLTGYAVSFNRRHHRCGHLFQNRFKSIVCQEDVYLKELVRYIHMNPARADLVRDLEGLKKYPYCGHSGLLGNHKREWQDIDYVLRYFGKTVRTAASAYLSYMAHGLDQGRRPDLIGGGLIRSLGGWSEVKKARSKTGVHGMGDERILGDSDFVSSILVQAEEPYDRRYQLKARGYDMNRVAEAVAQLFQMKPSEIFTKGRQKQKVMARSLFCFWAVRELGLPIKTLAATLEMTGPGVGYAVERGERIAKENGYSLDDN